LGLCRGPYRYLDRSSTFGACDWTGESLRSALSTRVRFADDHPSFFFLPLVSRQVRSNHPPPLKLSFFQLLADHPFLLVSSLSSRDLCLKVRRRKGLSDSVSPSKYLEDGESSLSLFSLVETQDADFHLLFRFSQRLSSLCRRLGTRIFSVERKREEEEEERSVSYHYSRSSFIHGISSTYFPRGWLLVYRRESEKGNSASKLSQEVPSSFFSSSSSLSLR